MTYFLPRECPECDRIISPAEKPKVGDLAMCPRCDTILVFIDGLLLRRVAFYGGPASTTEPPYRK